MATSVGGTTTAILCATTRHRRPLFMPFSCHCSLSSSSPSLSNQTPLLQQHRDGQQEQGVMCDACRGKGWLLCHFCNAQKTNVKTKNNRIYRRCPTCKAVGCILCQKCKVYKCVTFPDFDDVTQL